MNPAWIGSEGFRRTPEAHVVTRVIGSDPLSGMLEQLPANLLLEAARGAVQSRKRYLVKMSCSSE